MHENWLHCMIFKKVFPHFFAPGDPKDTCKHAASKNNPADNSEILSFSYFSCSVNSLLAITTHFDGTHFFSGSSILFLAFSPVFSDTTTLYTIPLKTAVFQCKHPSADAFQRKNVLERKFWTRWLFFCHSVFHVCSRGQFCLAQAASNIRSTIRSSQRPTEGANLSTLKISQRTFLHMKEARWAAIAIF